MKTTTDSMYRKIFESIYNEMKSKLFIYNTLTRQKDPVVAKNNRFDMFVCGPTVYNYAHIGHARSYVTYDSFVKFLKLIGISVFYIQNITDIDDKIINEANEKNVPWYEISRFYEDAYYEDMQTLHVNAVNLYARATEHIPEIIQQVQMLIDKGVAYVADDGIYFDITKFPEYGKLSRQNINDLKAGARVSVNEAKKHPWDFALWKFQKPNEPWWDAPFGKGRPGWHIEDTAIAMRYHGFQYDLHGGGIDLIFPHHESEIAQMEAISGKKPFVKIWMHHGFVMINKEKMSKSLGNFFTIRDFLKDHKPNSLRYFILLTHYRAPIDFDLESFKSAELRLEDLQRSVKLLFSTTSNTSDSTTKNMLLDYYKEFLNALSDDFNTPKANEVINKIFNVINTRVLKHNYETELAKIIITEINSVFDVFDISKNDVDVVRVIDSVVKIRTELRKAKLYQYSDLIRDELKNAGIELFDEKDSTKWIVKGE